MRLKIDAELDYFLSGKADVLLQFEAAPLPDQKLIRDKLVVGTSSPLMPVEAQDGIGRRTWTGGEGRFTAKYECLVNVVRQAPDLASLKRAPLHTLPPVAVQYLWPSRYCQPDRMQPFVEEEFGRYKDGALVQAIVDWARANLDYRPGCSDASTTAHDTFQQRTGICRDFAHVMIAMLRAFDIPARMVSAYAWELDPPDFHAVVEVYLTDAVGNGGWHLVDPTGLAPVEGLVRIGVGRDATDISFMTVFGAPAKLNRQIVRVQKLD